MRDFWGYIYTFMRDFLLCFDTSKQLLAIGASPIMARAEEEVEEISSKSNALALNLGVPESTTAHSMILAGEAAMKKRIPIVFDVVGGSG